MTKVIKTILAAVYALWSFLEFLWLKTETMMYLLSAPVWFSFFEWLDVRDSWVRWLWLALGLLLMLALIAAPILCLFRRHWLFPGMLGVQLVIRFVWLLRATDAFRMHFLWALLLHGAVFAGAVWLFRRPDMDAK